MLEESLGEGVAVQYLKDLNAAYLNHKNICDAARANDFSAVQLAGRENAAHRREAAQNNFNLKVFRRWIVDAIREFPGKSESISGSRSCQVPELLLQVSFMFCCSRLLKCWLICKAFQISYLGKCFSAEMTCKQKLQLPSRNGLPGSCLHVFHCMPTTS
jgi:hypothetical protein